MNPVDNALKLIVADVEKTAKQPLDELTRGMLIPSMYVPVILNLLLWVIRLQLRAMDIGICKVHVTSTIENMIEAKDAYK